MAAVFSSNFNLKKMQRYILLITIFILSSIISSAQSARQEAYSDFSAARNATPKSVWGIGTYYTEAQFIAMGNAAQRLYALSNQDVDAVHTLTTENQRLRTQVTTLTSELENLRRVQSQQSANSPTRNDIPNAEGQSEMSSKITVSNKSKSLSDLISDNLLLLVVVGFGIYYFYSNRAK